MKRSVLDYLENTAKRCPERLAWDASAPFTFGQWWDAAQRIASSLSSRCARNTPVAVLMNPRSAECVKVFFGVWAAGCFYAPLDPMLPPERLKLIMQNLQPTAIVYDEESRAKAEAVCPDGCECVLWSDAAQSPVDADKLAQIRQTVTPDHLAAILYTSGSTGIPKGVAHTQGSLMAYTEETIERYQFTENTVFGNQSPFFYANSIIDIFPPARAAWRQGVHDSRDGAVVPENAGELPAAEGHHGADDDTIELRAGGKQRRADGKLPAGA